jgi:hypothetical protein
MTRTPAISEQQKLTELARRYAERGYDVLIQPRPEQLPAFLAYFSPDLVLRGADGNIVIEVSTGGSAETDRRVNRLAQVVAEQPGWQFRFVLVGNDDPEWQPPVTLPSVQALRSGLDEVDALRRAGADRVAVLLLWSVIEGLLRYRLADRGLDPIERFASGALLKQALSEGYVDDNDYRRLHDLLSWRNAMAHGFVQEHVSPAAVEAGRQIAEQLLQPLAETA